MADLQDVLQNFGSPNISDLKAGDEDGSVTFQYNVPGGSAPDVTVQAFVPGEHFLPPKTFSTTSRGDFC